MNVQGKRVLVTGGAVRIGRAITEALLAKGADVVVHFRASETDARALSPSVIQADLSDPLQYEQLIESTVEQFGPLDILVNNAAVFHKTPLAESDTETVLNELHPNLLAPLALTRGFAKQTATGCVINLLDRRITSHDISCIPYMLSKKGLEELTKLAALELAPGIRVNAIAPGAILPPPQETDNPAWEPAGTIPLKNSPSPADIAAGVLYMLENDCLTGQTLFIDGGQNLICE